MRGGCGDWLHQPNGSWRRATHPFAFIPTTASSQHPSQECWLFPSRGSPWPRAAGRRWLDGHALRPELQSLLAGRRRDRWRLLSPQSIPNRSQHPPHHLRIRHHRDHVPLPTAMRTTEHVLPKHPSQKLRPRDVALPARLLGWALLTRHLRSTGSLRLAPLHRARHHRVAQRRSWR